MVIYGLDNIPTKVTAVRSGSGKSQGGEVLAGRELEFNVGAEPGTVIVHRVNLPVNADWSITLS